MIQAVHRHLQFTTVCLLYRCRDGKIFGLTLRVGRAITGSASLAADVVRAGSSVLLLGALLFPNCVTSQVVSRIMLLRADSDELGILNADMSLCRAGRPGVGKSALLLPLPSAKFLLQTPLLWSSSLSPSHASQCVCYVQARPFETVPASWPANASEG